MRQRFKVHQSNHLATSRCAPHALKRRGAQFFARSHWNHPSSGETTYADSFTFFPRPFTNVGSARLLTYSFTDLDRIISEVLALEVEQRRAVLPSNLRPVASL